MSDTEEIKKEFFRRGYVAGVAEAKQRFMEWWQRDRSRELLDRFDALITPRFSPLPDLPAVSEGFDGQPEVLSSILKEKP